MPVDELGRSELSEHHDRLLMYRLEQLVTVRLGGADLAGLANVELAAGLGGFPDAVQRHDRSEPATTMGQ